MHINNMNENDFDHWLKKMAKDKPAPERQGDEK
jgi:hypothetical protein